jgi:hypothetical protein
MKTLPKVLISTFLCAILMIAIAFIAIIKTAKKEQMVEEKIASIFM